MGQPSVKKNYIYSLLYQILTISTTFVTTPYVARILGAGGIGIYSYTFSCMTYFMMFASLGTSSYGMREISRCRDDVMEYSKKFWEIEILSVFTTLVCLLAWTLVIISSEKYRVYFIGLIPMLIAVMLDISWFYTGHEKIGYTVFLNAVCKILGVAAIFLFVKSRNDLLVYVLINSIVLMLGNLSMWLFLPKLLIKVDFKSLEVKKHLKETLIYFIPTIATTVYTVLDKTLIGLITQDTFQNGYYEQASKIINLAKTVVFVSVNKVMEARISYLYAERKIDEIKMRIEKSFSFILLLAYGAMFGLIAISKDFVPLFFGDGYVPVINLLYLMSPLVVIIGLSNCLGSHYYTPAGYRVKSAKYLVYGSIINLFANLLLIPSFKSSGAVIGSLIAEGTISYLYLKNCDQVLTVKQIIKLSYKKIIAGLVMMITILSISQMYNKGISLIIFEIVTGIFVYFTVLIIIRDTFIIECIKSIKTRLKS